MKLSRRKTIKAAQAKTEFPESHFIPYYGHWDSNTIVTKAKELLMVIKVEGYSFETADDEDVDLRKQVRNTMLKSVGSGQFALWFHILRRRQTVSVDGEQPEGFARYLNEKWEKKHEGTENFSNDLYITVLLKNDTQGMAKFEYLLKSVARKADKEGWEFELRAGHKDLYDMVQRMMGSLREYRPHLLGIRETPHGTYSELLEFLGVLVNAGAGTNMMVSLGDASRYLPTHRLYFGTRVIEARGPEKEHRYAGIVSIREYASYTSAGMIDSFLQLPFEFIISQSYVFTNRQDAISSMALHQRRMRSGGDRAISQTEELTQAMDLAMSGAIAFGKHHLTILCIEKDLKKLEDNISLAYGEIVNLGIIPVRETVNMEPAYWAQLPGNWPFVARGAVINTINLAGFCSLHNYPLGKRSDNHWGPAVTVFDTRSGTPYYFNFHVRDVGHTTIIGPTGAGKTVLMNFLCAQSRKYNARMFFFDKDRGAEIFIRALGGIYTVISMGEATNFNPLQLPDTAENRGFLVDWLRSLAMAINGQFTTEDLDRVNEAINGNFMLMPEDRTLTNIAPFFGLQGPDTLGGRMKIWHGDDSHAGVFDNKVDTLDLTKNRIFGFEMGEVLKDGLSLGPVLMYLFHRISMALDGTPTMVILDEAWALIDNDIFGPKIKDWLKTMRKLNAMVVFATQSVEDASKSNISDTLIQQTATHVFLPNPKATEEYRKVFMLTQREFALIKYSKPGERFFLCKQGSDVIVARIDLQGMEDVIFVLSGRAETVKILDEVRDEVGNDIKKWLPEFQARVLRQSQKDEAST